MAKIPRHRRCLTHGWVGISQPLASEEVAHVAPGEFLVGVTIRGTQSQRGVVRHAHERIGHCSTVGFAGTGQYVVREFPPERRKIDIGDYYSDYTLIRQRLGWEPKTPLKEALRRTVEFYRQHLKHYL